MQVLLFWLCMVATLLVYSIVGSMLMACVIFYVKTGVKLKTAVAHYGLLLGYIIFVAAVFYFLRKQAFPGVWGGAIIGVSLRYIFTTRRYVTNIAFINNTISVHYITNWFKTKWLDFAFADSNSVKLGTLKGWFDCLPKLKIKEGDAENVFYVVDKHIHGQIKANLDNNETTIALT